MNVVFHLNDLDRFKYCYSNVTNLLKEDEVEEIRVLMNGAPVKLTVRGAEDRVSELSDAGVFITVCQNALNSAGVDKKDLLEGVEVVRTGVFELMKRQEQGYSYIKV